MCEHKTRRSAGFVLLGATTRLMGWYPYCMLYEGVPIKKKKEDRSHPAPIHEQVFGRNKTIETLENKYQEELVADFEKDAPKDDLVFGREKRDGEAVERYREKSRSMRERISRFPFLNREEAKKRAQTIHEEEVRGEEGRVMLSNEAVEIEREREETREGGEDMELLYLIMEAKGEIESVGRLLKVDRKVQEKITKILAGQIEEDPGINEEEIQDLIKKEYRKVLGATYERIAETAQEQLNGGIERRFQALQEKGSFDFTMMVSVIYGLVYQYEQELKPLHEYFRDSKYDFSPIENYSRMFGSPALMKRQFEDWERFLGKGKKKAG